MKNAITLPTFPAKSTILLVGFLFLTNLISAQNCAVNAGLNQSVCVSQTISLAGSAGNPLYTTPAYQWTKLSGPAATITTPTAVSTTITGFTVGVYVFELASKCGDGIWARDNVTITVLPDPVMALAGDDVTVCSNTAVTLAANAVSSPYTGTWTVSRPGGTFSNINSANSTYTPTDTSGVRTLYWTISNGSCTSVDSMRINVVAAPDVNAGVDQTRACQGSSTILAASSPGLAPMQSGLWSVVSGPNTPVFSNVTSNTATISNLVVGSYILKWTVNGNCVNGFDNMVITVNNTDVGPITGPNTNYTNFCGSSVTSQVMAGAPLAAGETALWTQLGGGTGAYPNMTFSPNATGATVTASNLTGSFPYAFKYTKTTAQGCTNFAWHIIYRNPSIQNLSEPANIDLACDGTTGTFNMTYDELANITTGLTRTGTLISGPAAATAAFVSTSVAAGTRTEVWSASGMTVSGTYIFRIEYLNPCGSVYKDIAITSSITAGTVNAGSDIILPCNTLTANPIGTATSPGTYAWTQVSGPNTATLSNTTNLSLNMSGLIQGVYKMRMTLSTGQKCASKTDDMLVYVTQAAPSVATTGANATICAGRYQLAANTPQPNEIGTWTVSPSSGIVFSPNANTPNAFVSGLSSSTSYTFTWTVSNSCGSLASAQTLVTTAGQAPPFATAGTDICLANGTTSTALNGSAASGATILWTALTAGSSVSSTNTQATTANFTGGSGTYLFEYALSNSGCVTLTDTVSCTVNTASFTVNAGADQNICGASWPASATLTATPAAPAGTTALWTMKSGPSSATIASPTAASTTVTGLQAGIYEFEYRITNGACTDKFDVVSLRVVQQPSAAVAGDDQALCSATLATTVTLAATPPVTGAGYWTVVSGPSGSATPIFSNVNVYNTTIRNLSQGVYNLRWTVSNGPGCSDNIDDMLITVTATAAAGADIANCNINSLALTGNANTAGAWTQVSGPGGASITTNSPNTAVVTGLTASAPSSVYTFRYSLPAVGACDASSDDLVFTNYSAPSAADAGADVNVCFNASTATLTGGIPSSGTGTWTKISGPNTPTAGANNNISYDTILNNLIAGVYVYQFSVNNSGGCIASTDLVQVVKEITANAGTDKRVCNTTSVNLAGNTPSLYTGTWTLVSGPNTPVFSNVNNPLTEVTGMIAGTYVLRWTIANPGGCATNSDDVQVIIDPALAGVDAGPDASYCVGATSAFQIGTAAVGGITYTWSPALFLSSASAAQPTFSGVNNAGTFTYTLKGSNGTCEAFDAVTITMAAGSFNTNPSSTVKLPTGNAITLSAAADNASGYQWKKGAASISGANSTTLSIPVAELTDAGSYTLECISNGCTATSSAASVSVVVDLYSKPSGNLNVNTTWGVETDGTGSYPSTITNTGNIYTFTRPDHIYHIVNQASPATIGNLTFAGTLDTRNGATTVSAGKALIAGLITRQSGTGTLSGTNSSNIAINGISGVGGNSNLYFTTGSQVLKDLTLSNSSTCTLQTPLAITAGSASGTVTVNPGSSLVSNGNLTLKSDINGTGRVAQGASSGNYIVGDVTVERFIGVPSNSGRAWRILSIPTKGSQTMHQAWQENQPMGYDPGTGYGTLITTGNAAILNSGGFDALTYATSVITFNANTTAFSDLTTTANPIETTAGYFTYIRGDRGVAPGELITTAVPVTLRTKGLLYQGTQSPITVQADKFALIGNIYASAVDLTLLTRNNLDNAVYVWDPKVKSGNSLGIYQTFNPALGTWIPGGGSYSAANNNRVESGQGFFVHATGTPGTLAFNEAAKIDAHKNVFRPTSPVEVPTMQLLTRLYTVTAGIDTLVDATAALFHPSYTNGIDPTDNIKLANSGENLAEMREGKTLVIESKLPVVADDTLFFNIWNMLPRDYKFEFVPDKMAATGVTAYLKDKYLGTTLALNGSSNTLVNFKITAVPASYATDRFSVVFKPGTVLPVYFTSVNANRQNATVVVNWKVSEAINIAAYAVQRAVDGRTFTQIGQLAAQGSTAANQYSFTDQQPLAGIGYYRIVSIEKDGSRQFSQIVKVMPANTAGTITMAPNPVTGNKLAIQLNNQPKGVYSLRLVNNIGQLSYNTVITHQGGSASETIQLPAYIIPGIYQVEIILPDNSRQRQKLVVANK